VLSTSSGIVPSLARGVTWSTSHSALAAYSDVWALLQRVHVRVSVDCTLRSQCGPLRQAPGPVLAATIAPLHQPNTWVPTSLRHASTSGIRDLFRVRASKGTSGRSRRGHDGSHDVR
jgi:hypothetical protein